MWFCVYVMEYNVFLFVAFWKISGAVLLGYLHKVCWSPAFKSLVVASKMKILPGLSGLFSSKWCALVHRFTMSFRMLSWLPLLVLQVLGLLITIIVDLHLWTSLPSSLSASSAAFLLSSLWSAYLRLFSQFHKSGISPWPVCNCQLRSQWDYSNWSLRMLHVASMLRRRTNVTSLVSKSMGPDIDSPPHQNWCR